MSISNSTETPFERDMEGLVPLCHFMMSCKRFKISEEYTIRDLPSGAFDTLIDRLRNPVAASCLYGISTEWRQEFHSMNEARIDLTKASLSTHIVTALRLFDAGDVSFPLVLHRFKGGGPNPLGCHGWASSGGEILSPFGKLYELPESRWNQFRRFWELMENRLFSIDAQKCIDSRLDSAIRRFSYSYWLKAIDDKVIDTMVGFEALFGDQDAELTNRLVTRMSLLLGRNDDERVRLRRFLTKSYNIRSKIIHGRRIDDAFVKKELGITSKELSICLQRLLSVAIKTSALIVPCYWSDMNAVLIFADECTVSSKSRGCLFERLDSIQQNVFTDSQPLCLDLM